MNMNTAKVIVGNDTFSADDAVDTIPTTGDVVEYYIFVILLFSLLKKYISPLFCQVS